MSPWLRVWIALLWLPFSIAAHVGSPNVFFEGQAGPYLVHVVIRPPEVIPGLAEISLRVEGTSVEQVTALPIKWNAGRKGAPPPDVAHPVAGETNLYNAQLWFMEGGAQSVEFEITGSSGPGRVTVPVDAVARRVLVIPTGLGATLVVLGFILVALLVSVVGASVREGTLTPGRNPDSQRRLRAVIAMRWWAVLLIVLLWGGKYWWDNEATDYRNNRLYRPITAVAQVRSENGRSVLRLEITDVRFAHSAPLVPDHGKLMHLFLVREPKLDAFAHLHPIKRDRKTFESTLPDLPEGSYQLYADVTYETGLTDTLTTRVEIPGKLPGDNTDARTASLDSDDSWRIASPSDVNKPTENSVLSSDYNMSRSIPIIVTANQPVHLQFIVRDSKGQPVLLEPYLGMRGHLVLRHEDGSVFTHLHPGGTPSMAAMQLSVLRADGKLPLKAAFGEDDPVCQLPTPAAGEQDWLRGNSPTDRSTVSFPYAFPKAGLYRLWVQVKIKGEVFTGVFHVEVRPMAPS